MQKIKFIRSLLIIVVFAAACKSPDEGMTGKTSDGHNLQVEVLASDLEVPWGLDFLPNGSLIFTERPGQISILKSGATEPVLIHEREVLDRAEGGLLGLAVSPRFEENQHVFIYETISDYNQIVRFQLANEKLVNETVILDSIPKARFHNGGILRFGPDGYLYAGTGDAREPDLSQDKNSLAGKILRMDEDGKPADENPFENHVWSYGHRNVQGIDWDDAGRMIATEHGPSGEINGWCCHDEINFVEKGKNYGWPELIGDMSKPGMVDPTAHSGNDTWAPGGGIFIRGKQWGDWHGSYLLAGLRGQLLLRFELTDDYKSVTRQEALFEGTYKRLRNLIMAPDSSIVFCSSNRDGRTFPPQDGDDKIYRMWME